MKIIFTQSEFSTFNRLMKALQIPSKVLGCTEADPTIQIKSSVVNDYIEQGIESCSGIRRGFARKKVIEMLSSLPKGSFRKN